jgi:hypothetical protein
MRVNNGRPAKTYYADLSRIKSKAERNIIATDRVPLPTVFNTYSVTGVHLTESMREVIQTKQLSAHSIQDSVKPLNEQVFVLATATIPEIVEYLHKRGEALVTATKLLQENVEQASTDGTLDKKLKEDWHTEVRNLLFGNAKLQILLEYLVQHPYFDAHPNRMFETTTDKVDIGIPVIKERR